MSKQFLVTPEPPRATRLDSFISTYLAISVLECCK